MEKVIVESYSCSLISQGNAKFYSLTMPSEILAETCFVSTRDDDPVDGFQRTLDEKRAKEIAEYLDSGSGTIPTAIVLSAQPEAELKYNRKNKTIEFNKIKKGFLILDGQHRVYGFSMAKTSIRVPVIIYNGLSRKEETRLFIDINTKQRPVPTELLLDIKTLAEYDTEVEGFCRQIYDNFQERSDSALMGMMSPSTRVNGKVSRVTFNSAIKVIYGVFGDKDVAEIYEYLNNYLKAIIRGFEKKGVTSITKPTIFKAVIQFFPQIAQLAGGNYTLDNFYEILEPLFAKMSAGKIQKGTSTKVILSHFSECMNKGFTL